MRKIKGVKGDDGSSLVFVVCRPWSVVVFETLFLDGPLMTFLHTLIRIPAFWIIGLTALVYAHSLVNDFTFDDHAIVKDNPVVHSLDVRRIFSEPYWPNRPAAGLYRPVTTLSFALQHALHGVAPFGYHLVNVGLHAANAYLVFRLAAHLLPIPFGVATALVFALHPVQTEAVNGIVGRAELLSAFWVFAAVLLYIRSGVGRGGRPNRFYYFSLGVAFLGMLSKENAACVVGLLVVYDFAWEYKGRWPGGWGAWFKTGLPRYVPFVALVGLMLFLRGQVVGSLFLPALPAAFDNPIPHLEGLARWLMICAAIGVYLRLMIFPLRLSPDYSHGEIPEVHSVFDPLVLGPLLGVTVLTGLAVFWMVRRRFLAGAFGLLVFAVAFAPVSNVVVTIGTILGERLLYLPMAGFALFACAGASQWSVKYRGLAWVVLVVILALYSVRTGVRNAEWRDDLTLFLAAAHDGNQSAKVYYNLGVAYRKQGDFDKAIAAFEDLAERLPDDPDSWGYLGFVYRERGDMDAAIEAYERALALAPMRVDFRRGLGDAQVQAHRLSAARESYEQVLELRPDDVAVRYALALVCQEMGQMACAIRHCEILLSEYDFDHRPATVLLAALLFETERHADGVMLVQTALLRWPGDADVQALAETFHLH